VAIFRNLDTALGPLKSGSATTPSGSSIYWGAFAGDIATFQTDARKRVSIIQFGNGWWYQNSYVPFSSTNFDFVRHQGAIPLVDWRSWDYTVTPVYNQPGFSLSAIINGAHDAYVKSWATAAKQWGHPFFIRFDPEMNGDWYPYSELRNGNSKGQYIQAWRHVHDIFTQLGVTNATWVWCPNIDEPGLTSIPELYPGNGYVDWVAMDGYNFETDPQNHQGWNSFSTLFKPTYNILQLLAPTKPVMIAEVACSEKGGSKATWITDMLVNQLPKRFANVKAFVWFNATITGDLNSKVPGDWPIETSASAQSAFANGIASSYYTGNRFANLNTSPILPLGEANSRIIA
jgi:hypothetical protein